jgi:hypothetical protein
MVGPSAFLMKDFVLLAVSIFLLREDVIRLQSEQAAARFIAFA